MNKPVPGISAPEALPTEVQQAAQAPVGEIPMQAILSPEQVQFEKIQQMSPAELTRIPSREQLQRTLPQLEQPTAQMVSPPIPSPQKAL